MIENINWVISFELWNVADFEILGIKIKFADPPDRPWYEREIDRPYLDVHKPGTSEDKMKKEKEGKSKKTKKEKTKKRRRRSSSSYSSSSDDSDYEAKKKAKLAKLRQERLEREKSEKMREFDLLHPEVKAAREAAKKKNHEQAYHNQFNPMFAKQNRFKK